MAWWPPGVMGDGVPRRVWGPGAVRPVLAVPTRPWWAACPRPCPRLGVLRLPGGSLTMVWPARHPGMLTGSFPGAPMRDPGLCPQERLQLHLPSPSGIRSPFSVLWHQSRSPSPWGGRHTPSAQVTAQLSAAFSAPPLITSSQSFIMF